MNLRIGPGYDLDPSLLPYEDPFEADADLSALLRGVDGDLDEVEAVGRRSQTSRLLAQRRFKPSTDEVEQATRNIVVARGGRRGAAPTRAPAQIFGFVPDLTSSAPVDDEVEGMLPIMDPLHNAREIAKQLAMLEDHLIHPSKRCHDCIRKHLLTAEGLAEEAVSLSSDADQHRVFGSAAVRLRGVSRSFAGRRQGWPTAADPRPSQGDGEARLRQHPGAARGLKGRQPPGWSGGSNEQAGDGGRSRQGLACRGDRRGERVGEQGLPARAPVWRS